MSSNSTRSARKPNNRHLWSVRTLFLLIISGVSLFLTLVLLWSGAGIMDSLIHQYGTEIMIEKLHSLLQPVKQRYATLQRVGLEDSQTHRQEIRQITLREFANYRYKQTGSVFVIGRNGQIILSSDFLRPTDRNFTAFLASLEQNQGTLVYQADETEKFATYTYFDPWDSYIGISIARSELFALRNQFIQITLMLLAAVLVATVLFSGVIQRLLIMPLIRLTDYANRISRGDYDVEIEGKYILELGTLKADIQQMVAVLRQKMDQTKAQLHVIRERENWLDEALAALQESEKKYRTIYNAPTDAILIYDPQQKRIIDANKALQRMFGYNADEIQDLGFADLSGEEEPFTPFRAEEKISSALDEDAQLFEWLASNKNGDYFWVEISLQTAFLEEKKRIIAVIRNIHNRKMAEQALASEKERLTVTLRSIGDGVITTDKAGRVALVNRVAENLTGWQQFEAAGRELGQVFHIFHRQSGDQGADPVGRIIAAGERIDFGEETILINRNGSQRQIAHSGAPIRDPQSRIIGVVIVFRDITEEKRLEEELLKIRKLESVGVLAGGIAHDFNNILVAILGNVSLARQKLHQTDEAHELLKNTEKAALRAKDLTSQLLTFSRGGDPVIKTASIAEIIRESAEFVLRGSTIKLALDIPVDLWLVKVDTGQISQVIQNIVLNARQSIDEEGIIEIICRNCEQCSTEAEHLSERCVRVMIRDDGPGIPSEIQPKIFDPYFSTREEGSGLGLAICHSIVKKHGGYISVDSTEGRGTTFTIQLPVSNVQTLMAEEKEPDRDILYRKGRILVMDDDEMILELSRQMLEYLGHDVVTCSDGGEAVDLYRQAMEAGRPFDLAILDLTIPGGMGGEKTISRLREIDPDVQAVVSSGYSNDRVMAEYREYGFKAVVVKPYQMEDLDRAVRKILWQKS